MREVLNKDEVKILYLRGLNATEISKLLGSTKCSVTKCIQRNFKEYKDINREEKRKNTYHNREVIKAINYESRKWISDKAFMKKNRSIYRTNEDGDFVTRKTKDIGCKLPWDVPRKIING